MISHIFCMYKTEQTTLLTEVHEPVHPSWVLFKNTKSIKPCQTPKQTFNNT